MRNADTNKILQIFNLLSLVGGLFLLVNCIAWASASCGFDLGYKLAEKEAVAETLRQTSAVKLSSHGPETYFGLTNEYESLCYLSLGFIAVCLFKKINKIDHLTILSGVLAMFLFFVIWVKLRWLLGLKDPNMNESMSVPYNALVRESVSYDWFCVYVLAVLFFIQIMEFALNFVKEKLPFEK